ncbi:hypothetical protein [Streptosporangium sp. NPDC000396]|uniref:hypothetical protein n=1 Tax=Streptosporangium sp. NPDC000396 TaxID=3366185 RepID=UPI0036D17DC6
MIPPDECLSPHLGVAQRDHVRLVWWRFYQTFERVRVMEWTCACRSTVYELCEGGGRAFIRRIVQLENDHQVHETHRWSIAEARANWTNLLSGKAR